jgi:putative ABC transport system permease protein
MSTLIQDLRFVLRSLGKSRTFTISTILTLALVIGGGTAILSAIFALALKPLPYADSQQLVTLWGYNRKSGEDHAPLMQGAFSALVDQSKTFESLAAYSLTSRPDTLFPEKLWGTEESVAISASTSQLFPLLRVRPILGRTFDESEMIPWKSPRAAVLSYSFWLRRYGANRDVIGKTLELNHFGVRTPFTIVGVMPQGFVFPYPLSPQRPDLWVNISYRAASFNPGNQAPVLARLKSGATIKQAQAEVDTLAAGLRRQYPKYFSDETITVIPLQSELVRNIRPMIGVLLGAAGFLLLIGCANIGNLIFSQQLSRQRELGIRAAIGAGPVALARLMLTEAFLLAAAGGILGALIAYWGQRALVLIVPPSIYVPRLDTISHDYWLLILTTGMLVAVTAVLTVIPSLRLRRPNLDTMLKPTGPGPAVSRAVHLRPGSILLVSQVSLALALLVGVILLGGSLKRLIETNRAFEPDHLLVINIGFSNAAFRSSQTFGETEPSLFRQLVERVNTLPGVRSVALFEGFPPQIGIGYRYKADGTGLISENFQPADPHWVSPSAFEVLNLKLLRGRWLAETDTLDSLPVAVINQAMADRYWPGADPLGRQLQPMFRFTSKIIKYTIVGIIEEPKRFGAGDKAGPAVYQTIAQVSPPAFSVVIRATGDPRALGASVRRAALQMVPGQMFVGNARTGSDIVSEAAAKLRATTVLLTTFTSLALLIAAVGVYGLVSYHVAQRTHEIGIRMALGARPPDLLHMVFRESMALVALGTAIGLALSFSLSRALRSLLYEAPAIDVHALCGAALVFLIVALVAIYIPARRATKVDPMVALRYE